VQPCKQPFTQQKFGLLKQHFYKPEPLPEVKPTVSLKELKMTNMETNYTDATVHYYFSSIPQHLHDRWSQFYELTLISTKTFDKNYFRLLLAVSLSSRHETLSNVNRATTQQLQVQVTYKNMQRNGNNKQTVKCWRTTKQWNTKNTFTTFLNHYTANDKQQ